jgi:hypothetical protein
MIFASATKVQPANQNPGSYGLVESANALTLTTTGSVPVVTQSPFADLYKEGSIYFSGSGSNYITASAAGLVGTQWNTTGMTVEAWVNYPTFTGAAGGSGTTWYPNLVGSFHPTINYLNWGFGANTTGYVTFYYWNGSTGPNINATVPLSTNTWNHIAFSCLPGGATANIYVNGTQVATTSISGTPTTTSSALLTLGQNNNNTGLNAYVTGVRITTGAALYTGSSFTVPSAPLSPAATGVAQALIRAGANAPYMSNGALTFDRGLKQFANFGAKTFNIATRGFTAVFRYQFNGTVANTERIFQASQTKTDQSNSLFIARNGTGSTIYFQYSVGGAYSTAIFTGNLSQGTNYVISFVYNPFVSSGTLYCWVNGVPVTPVTGLASAITTDLLTPFTFVGCDYTGASSFTNASMNTFAVYNRALSNVEILNAYSALTTATTNAPIEIGDSNGTPAMSIAGDGRLSVTKLGQSSNVVPWPPAAMTGYDTVINGQVYKARASNDIAGGLAWQAFDKISASASGWASTGPIYSTVSPFGYTGTVTTTDVNGTVYPGEWLQIQLPVSITISSYTIYPSSTAVSFGQLPSKFVVLGSRDGVIWFLVNSQSGVTSWTAFTGITFTVAATQSYSYYRVVGNQMTTGCNGYFTINELVFNGTADTAQTLTVAQPVTLSYGAQTASLTGISGDKYVPQDFSSSGLNIPAYVVSNTATVANTVQYSSFGPFAGEGSLYFPGGTGAYVNFGQPAQLAYNWTSYDFTIEMFVFSLFTPSTDQRLFARDYEQLIYITTNNTLRVYMAGVTGPTSGAFIGGAVPQNQWSHVAVSWSQSAQTMYISVNGSVTAVALTAGTPTYAGTRNAVMGTWAGTNGLLNTSISNLRFTRGAALYTTTFTPPTQSLQPIQGVTQAGTPYGTVLLLRNAPAPGRIQTTKFSGANSGSVLAFPPAAMTTYATTLNTGYGQGTYVASASSELSSSYQAWQAFDKVGTTVGSIWASYAAYGSTSPYGTLGSNVTVDVTGTSYAGEWLQLQMPSSIILANYSLTGGSQAATQSPARFWILGSRDGTSWSLVDSRTGVGSWVNYVAQNFSVSSGQAFTYFRIVVNQLAGYFSVNPQCVIAEWTLNGTIEGPSVSADGRLGLGVTAPTQALEVAGSAVVAGTLSAGNPLMFRNRIINGDMTIAQRGTSNTSGMAFVMDRFKINSSISTGVITYTQNTLTTSDTPYQYGFRYAANLVATTVCSSYVYIQPQTMLEGYSIQDFNWGTPFGVPVTLSFWYRSNMPAGSTSHMSLRNYNVSTSYIAPFTTTGTWQYLTFTIPPPPSGTAFGTGSSGALELFISSLGTTQGTLGWSATTNAGYTGSLNWAATLNTYIQFTGVQLEKGTVATPYEIRPYATELALCQRYFETGSRGYYPLASAFGASYGGTVFYKVTKRASGGTITLFDDVPTAGKVGGIVSGSTTNGITGTAENAGVSGFTFTMPSGYSLAFFTWTSQSEL